MKEQDPICHIQKNSIRRIQVIEYEDSGRYQMWSLLQETPNTPYRSLSIRRAENLAADHLSRLENPDLGTFTKEKIADKFLGEHLMILKTKLNEDKPWIETNLFDYETPLCEEFKKFNYLLKIDPDLLTKDIKGFKTYVDYKDDWIYEWNKDIPWVHENPWVDNRVWEEPKAVEHCCKPFNYISRCSEWPTCNWMNDGYCNGGNLPGAYIIGNSLHYQDYKWYKALEEGELKDEALINKVIIEGTINDDVESCYKGWRSRYGSEDSNHDHEERECMDERDMDDEELFDDATHERPVCLIKRYEIIKYSFRNDEKYVAIREDEYDDSMSRNEEACQA
ncbi:hypothetical protein Tco_0760840 [Tanacetum coccineum]